MSNKAHRAETFLDASFTLAPLNEEQRQTSLELARIAARCAAESKGQEIAVLDMTSQTSIFDFFVIATGSSRRQLHAIADDISRAFAAEGHQRTSRSGYDESRWIVMDYGGVIVHLFDEETREYYDLEQLWADCPRIDLSDTLRETGAIVAHG